ncbi:MAG TPA: anthranilate phosphoribosyltransferase [Longimicrobiales bacterium]|nr:anthranilate phosphoribosyltransferase [Longimicrobiales bacterium]
MPNQILTDAIDRLASRQDLSTDEAAAVMLEMMEGRASDVQSAAFLIALRTKGETVEEVTGMARTMRELARHVEAGGDDLLDTAGTGGGRPTFNVSTTAAIVAAGAGCRVAKHGARSSTGSSGSADVLEALGARIDLGPEAVAECIEEIGFGFMFAPAHHAATRHVVPVRKELAVRTLFNFLGPLTNPAGAQRQVIGVSAMDHVGTIARALANLGCRSGLVVSSEDGLDEISVSGRTRVIEVREGKIEDYVVTPEELGVEAAPPESLRAGTPAANAEVTRAVLGGRDGPERSLTLLNAGAAIYVGGRAGSIADGVRIAEQAIDTGAAVDVLERFVARTRELAA